MPGSGLVLAIGLALIHAFASKLNISRVIPEHRWLSFAAGVSIGYVFLEIFPELSHAQEELEHSALPLLAYVENHVYILALLGLLVFYGLDTIVLATRRQQRAQLEPDMPPTVVFWIHIAAFAALNAIFGYLLQTLEHSLFEYLLFFAAVALHFFIVDHGLREHHQTAYDHQGRWVLTGAIIVGAMLGQATHLNQAAISIIWAFLAGSIILNSLKRELPDEQKNCIWSFVGGTALYTSLLLLR